MAPEVLETSGVEVPAGVEPEPGVGVVDPVGAAVVPLEPELEPEAEAEAEAEDDSVEPALVVSVTVSVAVTEVVAELEVEVLSLAEVVRIGASEIGTPAEEHWATTTFETDAWSATLQAFSTQGVMSEIS